MDHSGGLPYSFYGCTSSRRVSVPYGLDCFLCKIDRHDGGQLRSVDWRRRSSGASSSDHRWHGGRCHRRHSGFWIPLCCLVFARINSGEWNWMVISTWRRLVRFTFTVGRWDFLGRHAGGATAPVNGRCAYRRSSASPVSMVSPAATHSLLNGNPEGLATT